MSWRQDVDRVIDLKKDERFLKRVETEYGNDARAIIDAVIDTNGDTSELAKKVGPIALAKLHIHMQKAPAGVAKTWTAVQVPLKAMWTPPKDAAAIAGQFLERYAAGLGKLGDEAERAAKGAGALAASLNALASAKELTKTVVALQAETDKLLAAVERCTHADPNKPEIAREALDLSGEAKRTMTLITKLRDKAGALAHQVEELRSLITEWTNLPPSDKASLAESMATRIAAAREATLAMHQEFASIIWHTTG
ncbi:MAG: hypothetical protein ACXVQS_10730 [Actinomycetota bacterium]